MADAPGHRRLRQPTAQRSGFWSNPVSASRRPGRRSVAQRHARFDAVGVGCARDRPPFRTRRPGGAPTGAALELDTGQAMSEENMDTVRQSLVAFDRRDRAAWLALRDEDYEVVAAAVWPDAGVVRGREAAWKFYADAADTFEPRAFAATVDVVDAGADKVLVHQHHRLRGRASGAEVDFDFWVVATFRDGKIVRDEWFTTRADALKAVGLEE